MKRAHRGNRGVDGRVLGRAQCPLGSVELPVRYGEVRELHAVVAQGQLLECIIAPQSDRFDDVSGGRGDRRGIALRRTQQRGGTLRRRQRIPIEDAHGGGAGGYASIFSTGRTSTEVAPALFRSSSSSQNTFSRHTVCTATRSPRPSRGMTVGDSLPGSSFAIAGSAERGACSMMYLLPLTCSTPSMRINRR